MPNMMRAFFNALLTELTPLPSQTSSIQVSQQNEDVLVVLGNGREFVFNKRFRTVKSGTRVLALFDSIVTIDIAHHRADEGDPESWSVSLNLKGWFSSVAIGSTQDDVGGSIAAARIGTITGKQVRAL